jgi:hypothetical protein
MADATTDEMTEVALANVDVNVDELAGSVKPVTEVSGAVKIPPLVAMAELAVTTAVPRLTGEEDIFEIETLEVKLRS